MSLKKIEDDLNKITKMDDDLKKKLIRRRRPQAQLKNQP